MSRLKAYIQSLVTEKIPDAFTLRKAELPRKIPTGIQPLDLLIQGFQRGDLTEIYGEGSSGRTTLAISFMAEVTRRAEVCALVDVSDSLDPESLSVAGVDLNQLLWIRLWKGLEQALRVTDLLLNNGGFGAVVLDLGDAPIGNTRRIPLTSWFRFRRSVENTPTVLLLLSNEPCSGTCASLVLNCQCRQTRWLSAVGPNADFQVLTLEGLEFLVEVTRCRGQSQTEVMSSRHSSLASSVHWQTRMSWTR